LKYLEEIEVSGIFSRNPHSSALPIRENYEAKNVDELATLLQSLFASELQGIIAIDGRDGVGKSQLAAQLHERIGGTLISLDNYIEDALGIYVPALSINRLRKAVVDAAPPRLVEGVCLHDVLKAIDCNSTVNIYVRRLIGGSYWCHEAKLTFGSDLCNLSIWRD
jgi:hypothetical protein